MARGKRLKALYTLPPANFMYLVLHTSRPPSVYKLMTVCIISAIKFRTDVPKTVDAIPSR